MSGLSELSGAGDMSLIPGYTLSPLTLLDFGLVEKFINSEHLRSAGQIAAGLPVEVAKMVLENASNDVKQGVFRYGSPAFDIKLLGNETFGLLLYLSIKKTSAGITQADAEKLITKDNQYLVKGMLLKLCGFDLNPKKAEMPDPPEGDTTGSSLLVSSESAA